MTQQVSSLALPDLHPVDTAKRNCGKQDLSLCKPGKPGKLNASEVDAAPHVEVTLTGGVRLMWDSTELMRSIDPAWIHRAGNRVVSA